MRHRNGEPADHWERPIAVAVVGILVLTCLVWILILTGCGGDGPAGPDLPPDVVAAEATITAVDLAARVGALAHDSMRGRATPSPELEAAARWAASEFASFGLQAEGDVGYLQWYLAAPGDPAEAVNVIGRLAGSDPALRDEFVVIAAHFDHLGVGEPVAEDSVYNGADDNGSGTAAVLELAEAFASLATPPRRSVLFVLFSGEERGLLGSSYYSEHPAAPMASTTAMINLDMLGRNWPDRVAAVYQPESDIGGEPAVPLGPGPFRPPRSARPVSHERAALRLPPAVGRARHAGLREDEPPCAPGVVDRVGSRGRYEPAGLRPRGDPRLVTGGRTPGTGMTSVEGEQGRAIRPLVA
jgi:hypothetical protein